MAILHPPSPGAQDKKTRTVPRPEPLPLALSAYQESLPYVRAHDANGQWALWCDGTTGGPMELREALRPAAELVAALESDGRQLELFSRDGVRRNVRWRRDSAGGAAQHRSWAELDRAIRARARFSGRPWCEGDQRTLEDVYAQTMNAADARKVWTHQTWIADVAVCPLSGDVVRFPKPWQCRRIVDILVVAYDKGQGGTAMSHDDWAAELRCCVRSVYTYMRALIGIGAVQEFWLRKRGDGPKGGTAKHHKLYRLGPLYERYATLLSLARRGRGTGAVRQAAAAFRHQLERRAARRKFDLAGATYRGRMGRAESTRGSLDRRTRESKRQIMPHSPPLSGLANYGPPKEGRGEGTRVARGSSVAVPTGSEPTRASTPPNSPRASEAAPQRRLEGGCSRSELELGRLLAEGAPPPDWVLERWGPD